MLDYDKELNDVKIKIRHKLAVKQSDLTIDLRKQPFQHNANVSNCPAWAIQVFAEMLIESRTL